MSEQKQIATRAAYGEALVDLGATMPELVVLDADLSKSTMTVGFAKAFPNRFFNMGIAEANMIGVAAGMSTQGLVPFASTFAIFATGRAYDQIRNGIAYADLNVKIAATHAGLTVGEDGGSHQALEDIGLMRGIPRMSVIVPSDAKQTKQAVALAASTSGPVYLRLGRSAVPNVHTEDYQLRWGKADILREGNDLTICATGYMTFQALEAAEELAKQGFNVEVIDVPFIKPIDKETICNSASKTSSVLTVEEHSIFNGLGSAVAEVLSERHPVPLRRLAINDVFGESGKPAELMHKHGLTVEGIIAVAKQSIALK